MMEQKDTAMNSTSEKTKASSNEGMSERGWAWIVVIGCCVTRCLTDGLISSLGMFIIAWQDHFEGSLAELTWISSLIAGLECGLGLLGSVLLRWFSIRQVVMAGGSLTSAAFIGASFASKTWQLYLTSTLAGCGLGLTYLPSLVILQYYFDKNLGLVCGITSGGVAIGMLVFPSLFQVLITHYRWQGAMLILAALVANICVCGAIFRPTPLEMKAKTSLNDKSYAKQLHSNKSGTNTLWTKIVENADLKLFKNIFFVLFLFGFCLIGFAYIIFLHFLPLRVVNVGFSHQRAAYLSSVIGAGSILSRLTHGVIIDRNILRASTLTSLSYIVSGIANLLIPLSNNYPFLMTSGLFIGLSNGVYNSTYPLVAKDLVGIDHISCGLGWALLLFGLGNIFGSYLTGVLVDATGTYDFPFYLAGISFMICALFTSMKALTEYVNSVRIPLLTREQKQAREPELKGVHNQGMDIKDINIYAISGSNRL